MIWKNGKGIIERGKNVVQEEDRFEALVRIFSDGKDILYIYIYCVRAS